MMLIVASNLLLIVLDRPDAMVPGDPVPMADPLELAAGAAE